MTSIDLHGHAAARSFCIRNFINGIYQDCLGVDTIIKYAPHTGQLLYEFGEGEGTEVRKAVASARESFNDGLWSGLSIGERKALMCSLADLVE